MLRHLDLFSGIGGFALAARMVGGYETVAFCEIDPFCRMVLRAHWPGVPVHDDVRTLSGIECDIITGGFPCQDISFAGTGAGIEGSRSGLWSEYTRLIGEIRPRYILVENVAALLGRGLDRVLGDLAALGFDAEWHCIPASAVGAPHRRDRIWIMAYAQCDGRQQAPTVRHIGELGERTYTACGYRESETAFALCGRDGVPPRADTGDSGGHDPVDCRGTVRGGHWRSEPPMGRVVDGLSSELVEDELHALGNAIVPQVAAIFLQIIKEANEA